MHELSKTSKCLEVARNSFPSNRLAGSTTAPKSVVPMLRFVDEMDWLVSYACSPGSGDQGKLFMRYPSSIKALALFCTSTASVLGHGLYIAWAKGINDVDETYIALIHVFFAPGHLPRHVQVLFSVLSTQTAIIWRSTWATS